MSVSLVQNLVSEKILLTFQTSFTNMWCSDNSDLKNQNQPIKESFSHQIVNIEWL